MRQVLRDNFGIDTTQYETMYRNTNNATTLQVVSNVCAAAVKPQPQNRLLNRAVLKIDAQDVKHLFAKSTLSFIVKIHHVVVIS